MTLTIRQVHDIKNSSVEQPSRREQRASFKQNLALLFSLICCATLLSSFQASIFLHHKSVDISALEDPASSIVLSVEVNSESGRTLLRREAHKSWHSLTTVSNNSHKSRKRKRQLDFIIAGFPKTGTTSLLHAFGDNPETDVAPQERCPIVNPMVSEYVAAGKLQEALSGLSGSSQVQRGIKCPNTVYFAYTSIVRFEQYAPKTKFIIGVRHPIEMLQSYYNYRITELYDSAKSTGRKISESIPQLEDLVGMDKEWKGVSTDSTRYEIFLMQFGKTSVTSRDLREMIIRDGASIAERRIHHLAVKPNKFSIFLYTLDQLEDTGDKERSTAFRSGLQDFLGLEQPLKPVGRENLNHFVGQEGYPETVDICWPKYKSLRELLIRQGARSAQWIAQEFIHSPDVVVANRDHFLKSINTWLSDPCEEKSM